MHIMKKEILQQPEVLKGIYAKNSDTLSRLVAEIDEKKPHTLIFAGRGTSNHACIYAKYLIEIHCGIPVSLAAPSEITRYKGELNLRDTIVVAVSQSGMAQDALEIVRAGNAAGAITASITNHMDSPLSTEAKFALDCAAQREFALAATKTYTSSLFLLFALAAGMAKSRELEAGYARIPAFVEHAIGMADEIEKGAERFRFMDDCFVLARGYNFAAACEGALKMNETSYTRARAYAVSEFHHGPFAMVDSKIPAFVIDCDAVVRADTEEMLEKLEKTDTDIILITTDAKKSGKYARTFVLPEECEGVLSIFPVAVILQLFAYSLSELKGVDAAAPRGLSKVTITR